MSKIIYRKNLSAQQVCQLLKSINSANQIRTFASNLSKPVLTQYGGKHRVTLIHGDGIGPEMMSHVKEAFRYVRAPVHFEDIYLNSTNVSDEKEVQNAILSVKRNGAALKGNIYTDHNTQFGVSVNVQLRTKLDLFANVLRCKTIENVPTRHSGIDIMIIRENTEGEYSSLEHESVPGVVESLKIITKAKSTRIAEFAFDKAKQDGRKKITAVHKANIMKLGDGLFLESCKEVSKRYPDIKFETMIVDNTCMQLVSKPQQFDMMVMPNLYGNIVANICTGLVGGAGIISGSNYGYTCAMFESGTRNSGNVIAGKNIANPSGMLFAAANMLKYIGLEEHATVIRKAIVSTISVRNVKTIDIGGNATTSEFMKHILEEIQKQTPEVGLKSQYFSKKALE